MCVFFSVLCVCVRLARQGPRRRARSARTSSTECAAMHKNSKQSGAKLCRILKKTLHRLVNSPRDFPPQIYTILKKTFRHYHATPPRQSVQIWPTFPRDFPKRLLEFLPTPYATHLGNILCANLADFHHNFLA